MGLAGNQEMGVFRQPHPRSKQLRTPVMCLVIVLWVSSVWMGWVDFLLFSPVHFRPFGDAAGPEVPCSLAHSCDHWFPCTEDIVLQRRNDVLTWGSSKHSRGESRGLPKAPLGSCAVSHYFAQGKSQGQFIFMGWKSRLNLLMGEAHHRKVRFCVALYMKQRS